MPVTDKLSRKLRETLGDEAAGDMVNWMQRVDEQRAELRELNGLNFARFDARFNAFEVRFDALSERFDAHWKALDERFEARWNALDERFEARLNQRTAELRQEMRGGFAEVRQEIAHRSADLLKWSFVFWIGAVGAVAALAGVLR